MKINLKFLKPSHYVKESNDIETTTIDGGHNYTQPQRFKKLSELMARYKRARERRGTMNSWMSIMKQYDRIAYKTADKKVTPNFGGLRSQVDQVITTYVDYATEREVWAKVTTDYGDAHSQNVEWSDYITKYFHKYCIKKWKKSWAEIMLAVKDMLLFSKGSFVWLSECCIFPENLGIERIWPDSEAGMFAESFDTLFVEHRFTAVELFRKIEDADAAKKWGWDRQSVLKLLRGTDSSFKDIRLESIYQQFSENAISAAQADFVVDVVFAYVKEYKSQYDSEEDQNDGPGQSTDDDEDCCSISKYIFPSMGNIPVQKVGTTAATAEDQDSLGYLLYSPSSIDSMEQVIAIVAHTVCRNFYDDPSFAQLIYVGCKTYDMVMARILQAIEDNMRVYLRSENSGAFQKLQKMRHGNIQVLEPGMKLEQDRIQHDVMPAAQILREITIDQRWQSGSYLPGGLDSKSQPKTAKQSEIDLSETNQITSSSLKIFNGFFSLITDEMYRRFVTYDITKTNRESKLVQKFTKALKAKGVPKEAWQPENCQVDSVASLSSSSPASRLQSARIVMEAIATPAGSPGEMLAKRRMIAAAEGVDSVDAYLPSEMDVPVPEDSLIGLENDSLSLAGANPQNIPVLKNQLHMRHIPRHIQDAGLSLQAGAKLFQTIQQFPKSDEGVILHTINEIMMGVDNKLAHARAHIQMAGQGGSKTQLQMLHQFAQQIEQINRQQDNLDTALQKTQEARMQDPAQADQSDGQLKHQQAMYAMEEEHTQKMHELDLQRNEVKGDQLRQQSAANAENRKQLDALATQGKLEREQLKAQADIQIAAIKANKP